MASSNFTADVRAMLDSGVFLDPILANHYLTDASDPRVNSLRARARDMSNELYAIWVYSEALPTDRLDDSWPFIPSLMQLCLFECLLSTSMAMMQETVGRPEPTEASLDDAKTRLMQFIEERGLDTMYNIYFIITGHDLFQPLYFHKDVTEVEFLSGVRHHPFCPEHLENALLLGLAMHTFRLKNEQVGRTVQLTRLGADVYRRMLVSLRDSGYFEKRVQFAYLYQFDSVEDWDEMCDVVWPDSRRQRREYLQFVGRLRGKRVLEVACGTGAVTFDAELYERVGPTGKLVALDISTGMLDQARRKWEALGQPPHVELCLGSAEHIPFPSNSFDASVGVAFIHFVDAVKTLTEMARSVVPGGVVSIFQGTRFTMDDAFFREWFEPIFALARHRNAEQPRNYMPEDRRTLVHWFEEAGLKDIQVREASIAWVFDNPEIVVQHLVRGVSFFESELMQLPWDDRKAIVSELIDRGRDVCASYPLKQRTIKIPMYAIKGYVE